MTTVEADPRAVATDGVAEWLNDPSRWGPHANVMTLITNIMAEDAAGTHDGAIDEYMKAIRYSLDPIVYSEIRRLIWCYRGYWR